MRPRDPLVVGVNCHRRDPPPRSSQRVPIMKLLLDRFALFYPMRIVGTTFMVIVATLYAWHLDRFGPFYYGLVLVLVVYPHVVHAVARKYPQKRRAIELRTFLLDS